ncbi:hypothetical protein ACTXG7_19210 [Mycolicibacterium sp. Dal123E01]|uniref:hypothetical protein n=1 Tax=Mycolicibacterium sp. Dal123E01 TaxID=3457578 RepID=UPI00403E7737
MLSVHAPVRDQEPTATRVVDTRPTVLITEQQVKLLTAAAMGVPPKQRLFSRWIGSHRAAQRARSEHRRYTAHYEFLEHAAMARAMQRL